MNKIKKFYNEHSKLARELIERYIQEIDKPTAFMKQQLPRDILKHCTPTLRPEFVVLTMELPSDLTDKLKVIEVKNGISYFNISMEVNGFRTEFKVLYDNVIVYDFDVDGFHIDGADSTQAVNYDYNKLNGDTNLYDLKI